MFLIICCPATFTFKVAVARGVYKKIPRDCHLMLFLHPNLSKKLIMTGYSKKGIEILSIKEFVTAIDILLVVRERRDDFSLTIYSQVLHSRKF